MRHYEERLENDLATIRGNIAKMATRVEQGISDAVRAFRTGDHNLAADTILADHQVNREMREIDRLCHSFLAVHLPSGRHLRILSSAIRANIALERIGDYAVTIARASEQLSGPPDGNMGRELERIAREASIMLAQAVEAFNELDAGKARATMVLEKEMEYDMDAIYAELTQIQEREKIKDLLAIFIVFTHLKRVADQAKNLCEETVFAETGQEKARKVYNILFVDEDNSCLAKLAELVARKTFPASGHYSSRGKSPAAGFNPGLVEFLQSHGFDLDGDRPRKLEPSHPELVGKHVIVSLQGPVRDYIPQLPFHTTAVEWQVRPVPSTGPTQEADKWETLYRDIASRVRSLMEVLCGPDPH